MPFDFNLYSSLLLPSFIQGGLFALLLFFRGWRQERISDKLLAWLLLLNAIKIAYWMLGFAGWYDLHNRYTSFMFYFPFDNIIWMGPLLYFYFLALTNADFAFQKQHRKHFIFPIAWLLLMLLKFIIDIGFYQPFPDIEDTQYGTKGPWADIDKNNWTFIISHVSFFYYLFITLRAFGSYQRYVKQNFSATEEIRFDWLRNLLYAISAGVLVFFFFMLVSEFKDGGNSYKFQWYAYWGLGITIYYLSIAGYFAQPRLQQQLHFVPEQETDPITSNTEKEALPDLQQWKERLLSYMDNNKPYLEPELNLSELSKQLNTNTSLLSRAINDGTGRNFNDFINYYRVQEVIAKLKSGEQKTQTLLGIAYDCGFNSKATFNRAFKKVTSKPPREFMEEISSANNDLQPLL